MASIIVRYQGTFELECSNRAAKQWENDGEVPSNVEKEMDKIKDKLSAAIDSAGLSVVDDVELEVEEAQPDD